MIIPILVTLVTYSPWKKLGGAFTMFPFIIFPSRVEQKRFGRSGIMSKRASKWMSLLLLVSLAVTTVGGHLSIANAQAASASVEKTSDLSSRGTGLYPDAQEHWAQAAIAEWSGYGVVQGYENGLFQPDAPVSRAEFAALIQNIVKYAEQGSNPFSDVQKDQWFYEAVLKLNKAGVMEGADGKANPQQRVTRQEAAVLAARAFHMEATGSRTAFADDAAIAPWAKGAVSALASRSILQGQPDGTLRPNADLTRAEAVALFDQLLAKLYVQAGEYTGDTAGNVLVNAPGTVLRNANIKGDLYIAPGVGDGEVTLDGVTVSGAVYVQGGGEHSIILHNAKVTGAVVVNKYDGKVRLLATGTTAIASTVLKSGALLVTDGLTGAGFQTVTITAGVPTGQSIKLDGSFGKVVNQAPEAKITANGSIKEFVAEVNTQLSGDAKLEKVTQKEGVSATLNDKPISSGGPSGTVSGGPGGGGSNSGNPGSGDSDGGSTVPVSNVTLDVEKVTLHVGQQKQLTATVSPANASNKAVTWRVSDDSADVVTVSAEGLVTANAPGTKNIEVTTAIGGFKAVASVTVNQPALGVKVTPFTGSVVDSSAEIDGVLRENSSRVTVSETVYAFGHEHAFYSAITPHQPLLPTTVGHAVYAVITLVDGAGQPLTDTEGLSVTVNGATYHPQYGAGLADSYKQGSFLFLVQSGEPEAIQKYQLRFTQESVGEANLTLIYRPEGTPVLTGFDVEGEGSVGQTLTIRNIRFNQANQTAGRLVYAWYRSADPQGTYVQIGSDDRYVVTHADADGYIVATVSADEQTASGSITGTPLKIAQLGDTSIIEAKAIGLRKVEVKFSKAVDPAVAKLTLTKGDANIATRVLFSQEGTSAVLELVELKLTEGSYQVAFGGLPAEEMGIRTAGFSAENESLARIEFANTSEHIAMANPVIVRLKGINQYGEVASFSTISYKITAYDSNQKDLFKRVMKNKAGELQVYLDTSEGLVSPDGDTFAVTIFHEDSGITVSKNFTKGFNPIVSKVELGRMVHSNGGNVLEKAGDSAVWDIIVYDQYGNLMPMEFSTGSTGGGESLAQRTSAILTPYEQRLSIKVGDSNQDGILDAQVTLNGNLDRSGEFTLDVYCGAAVGTTAFNVKAAKMVTKLELGEPVTPIAAGDIEAYIPLKAFDADGNQLSVEELTYPENISRISLSASAASAAIVDFGPQKGMLKLSGFSGVPHTKIYVFAGIITPNVNEVVTKEYTVSAARIPEMIQVLTEPAPYLAAGAETSIKVSIYDQYGKLLKNFMNLDRAGGVSDSYQNAAKLYRLAVTNTIINGSVYFNNYDAPSAFEGNTSYYMGSDVSKVSGMERRFSSQWADPIGYASVRYALEVSTDGGATWSEITVTQRRVNAFDPSRELNYTVSPLGELFSAVASSTENDRGPKTIRQVPYSSSETLTLTEQLNPVESRLAREVVVTAKDAEGNTVAIPKLIKSLSPSDPSIVKTGLVGGTASSGASQNRGYVLGNKAGTTSLDVTFMAVNGELRTEKAVVTVKDDPITVADFTATNTLRTNVAGNWGEDNVFALFGLKVTDNYGRVYSNQMLQKYNYLFGITFSVQSIRLDSTSSGNHPQSVVIDQFGNIYNHSNAHSFEITATTASGKSVTLYVTRQY